MELNHKISSRTGSRGTETGGNLARGMLTPFGP
jgi:hypothetical protein